MAQDFYRAFGVGEDRRHIASVDADGVALAAVKGLAHRDRALNQKVDRLHDQRARIRRQAKENRSQDRRIAKLERAVRLSTRR
jgi:hypothetical protein